MPEPIVFYTDDDVDGRAIPWARNLGVEIVTANDAGNRGAADPVHFRYAVEHDHVLVTGNVQDFEALFYEWAESGQDHPGLVLINPRVRRSYGLIAEHLQLLSEIGGREYMRNRVYRIR